MELNEAQNEAVRHRGSPLLILAGAGSGKTRALTERVAGLIAQRDARPSEILAITFTNKAAREMQARIAQRLSGEGVPRWVMTFHRASLQILRRDIDRLGYPSGFTVYDSGDQMALMRSVLKELNLDAQRFPPARMLGRISRAKSELRDAASLDSGDSFYDHQLSQIFRLYQRKLQGLGAVDFDDLIGLVVALFRDFPDVARAWQSRFRHILVDEYQDTNVAQYEWIRQLAGGGAEVAVVGDPDQSIYGWRGADIRNILDFEKDFPGARIIRLTRNYRSSRNILEAANAVVGCNKDRLEKDLWTEGPAGEPIELVEAEDDKIEARWIARKAAATRREGRLSELAVLYRTNAQSRAIEEALMFMDIPYRLVGGLRFYEREEVRHALAYLRLVNNSKDDMAFTRIVNVPRRGIGDTTVGRLAALAAELQKSLYACLLEEELETAVGKAAAARLVAFKELIEGLKDGAASLPLSRFVEEVLTRSGLRGLYSGPAPDERSRQENLDALVAKAKDAEGEGDGLEDFLSRVALLTDLDDVADGEEVLTLMTLHAAKGLEFAEVILSGCEEGLLPHGRSLYEEKALEEERRLFYVGVTRAKERLYLTRAGRRTLRGENLPSMPSRFLEEIPPELKRQAGEVPAAGAPVPGPARALGASAGSFAAGQEVIHPHFGRGTVVQVKRDGEEVTVAFPGKGIRTLLASIAGLRRAQ